MDYKKAARVFAKKFKIKHSKKTKKEFSTWLNK